MDPKHENARAFDTEQLRVMSGDDRELMHELVELYAGHAEIEWPMPVGAVREGALDQIRSLAHALKGTSLTIGAEVAARALQQVEEAARGRSLDNLRDAVESARGAYSSACRQMRALLAAA